MTPQDIAELDHLAGVLASAAGRIKRAAALLRLAGDMDKIERRLAMLGDSFPALGSPPAKPAGEPAGIVSSISPAVARLPAIATTNVSLRACAVFAEHTDEGRINAKRGVEDPTKANGGKSTAQDRVQCVPRGKVVSKDVPF
jgi:hypothetical protein